MADLLADNRALLHKEINYLQALQQPLVDQSDQLNDLIHKTPTALNLIGRSIGLYGDWVNFYCATHDQVERTASRRPGPHGQDLAAAHG